MIHFFFCFFLVVKNIFTLIVLFSIQSDFFHSNWQISILYSLLYLILVHFGTKWMRDRRKLNLRLPLAIWSGVLTLFSMLGTWSCLPEFISIIYNKGLVASYCDNCYIKKKELIFWYTIFSLSKIIELGDTVFIVLRKQRLITLHWIHHAMTLVYTFYIFGFLAATARWMVREVVLGSRFFSSFFFFLMNETSNTFSN